jgi:hypothetical protein
VARRWLSDSNMAEPANGKVFDYSGRIDLLRMHAGLGLCDTSASCP